MKNDITQFLDLFDPESELSDIRTEGHIKYVTIKKLQLPHFCPVCGSTLHSKGTFVRKPAHQILQDGYELDLTVIGRRRFCPAKGCTYSEADQFRFLQKYKKTTNILPFLICTALKDLNLSCVQVAKQFGVSDTYVHNTFMRFVDLKRKPLPKYLCIDEVYINLSPTCKYALVLMDFVTGEIIDILETRRKYLTESYFLSIPKEERDAVEYIICDMYSPYINYTASYFHNAKAVTDSFHVLQWLLKLINDYYNKVKKRYQKRDAAKRKEEEQRTGKVIENPKPSREVFLLNHGRWVMTMNPDNITYSDPYYNSFLGCDMDTYKWEKEVLSLDSNFSQIRLLKNAYETFNKSYPNDLDGAADQLDNLISQYKSCSIPLFHEFANLLTKYREYIINSFVYASCCTDENHEQILRRLSNGPMESFNHKPTSLRSASHGISNFAFFRNRILWAVRKDAPILAVPKPLEDIKVDTGKKRGKYKK